ncbi:Probable nucleoredoxin 1 [Seminavis robusta]|uniref:protein-disulfide reductase n=1 Tax=Seminavis robusta TaxID=568900 RepID=A0A9N8EGS4_9STRA|nr:Probable nucleoredoxin 1 [Seminavis robusta]|eukprot:Sro1141_g245580.1 Probable nucleoredoxin 1 (144) ;mRNA; f:5200-5792
MPKKKPSTFEALLGPMLLSKIGEYIETPNFRNFKNSFFHHGPSVQTDEALKGKDFIVLYFSGAWCPSCQRFTPLLKDFYAICKDKANQEKLKKVDIEIVYISSDRDLDEFQKTYRDMPWLAWKARNTRHRCPKSVILPISHHW